jgi:hypothetical protein
MTDVHQLESPIADQLPRALLSVFTDVDKRVAAMVMERRGEANALPIREIVAALWPAGGEDPSCPFDPPRTVKDSVERLRDLGKLKIAGTRKGKGGYYVPASAQEAQAYASQCFQEAYKRLKTGLLFDPKRNWVREMNGQGNLFGDR